MYLPVVKLFVAQMQASGNPYVFVQLIPIEEKSSSKQQCVSYTNLSTSFILQCSRYQIKAPPLLCCMLFH